MTRSHPLVVIAAAGLVLAMAEPWRHRTGTDGSVPTDRHAPASATREPPRPVVRDRPAARREAPAPTCRRLVRDPRKGYVEVVYRC